MRMLKKLAVFAAALGMFISTSPSYAKEKYEEKTYANEVFEDANVANQIEGTVILSIDTSFGFINNVKSKIDEVKNLSPYRVAEEIYIPVKYVAQGMGLEVKENESGIIVSDNGKEKTYTKEDAEIKKDAYFIFGEDFCKDFGFGYTVVDDIVIISRDGKKFDTENKKTIDSIKTAFSYEWSSFQIHAYGYTTGIFVHPKNPDVVWIRTDVGGAYKLDVKSDKWICMTDCISGYNENNQSMWLHQPVEALAFDPNDENTVYIAVGNSQFTTDMLGAIYKTTDGGNSWKMLGLRKVMYGSHPTRMNGEMLAVDPNNSDVIYCGTYYDGLWKSEDGGETWSSVPEIAPGMRGVHDFAVTSVVIDGKNQENGKSTDIYVGVTSTGIYHSDDGGTTFKLMPNSPITPSRMRMQNGELYVAAGILDTWVYSSWAAVDDLSKNGLFRYHKGNWINIIQNTNLANNALGDFYINKNNPDNIVITTRAFTFPRKMYRTLDGGETWDDYTLGDTYNSNACCLVKDPKNENGMLLAWGFGVSRVPDITAEKMEFEIYDAGIEELMFREIRCLPEESKLNWVAGCCDKGCIISKGIDDWAVAKPPTWNFCNGLDFCESDPEIIVRAHVGHNAPPGKIILTDNSGETWQEAAVFEGTLAGNVAVGATKQKNGFPIIIATTTTVGKSGVYRSKDLGKTWENLDVPFTLDEKTGRRYLLSDRVNGNVFYFWSDDGFLYRTMNGGDTWNKISSILAADYTQFFDAVYGHEGHLWACLGSNGLAYSTDYGVRWNTVSGMTNAKGISFGKCLEGSEYPAVYVMGTYNGEEGMFRSDDYGKTWVSIASSFSYGGAGESAYISADRNYYGRIWLSTNGRGVFYGQPKNYEKEKPEISLTNPLAETVINDTYTVSGRMNVKAEVRINNIPVEVSSDGYFSSDIKLENGENKISIEAADSDMDMATPVFLNVVYDPSYIDIKFDKEEFKSNKSDITISGKANRVVQLDINGEPAEVDDNNSFSYSTKMQLGDNIYKVTATADGYIKTYELHGQYETTPPVIEYTAEKQVIGDGVVIKGKIDKAGEVRINGYDVKLMSDNSFESFLKLKEGDYPLIIQARDTVGNVAKPVITTVHSEKLTDFKSHDGNIPYAGDAFKISGKLSDDFGELPYACNLVYSGETTNVANFGLKWDEEALYIGVRVIDDILSSTGTNYYDRDCIEVYIDGSNAKVDSTSKTDTYKQFIVPYEGAMSDGCERMCNVTDYGYDMEIKIPWKNVGKGIEVKQGYKIGLDLDNCDTSGTAREAQVGWCGTSDSYKRTDYYATMTLVK